MKVLILSDGKTALKQSNREFPGVCVINGLLLKAVSEGRDDIFYGVDDPFFKIACPPGTVHEYETLPDGKINLT